jgi:hypothetical protein
LNPVGSGRYWRATGAHFALTSATASIIPPMTSTLPAAAPDAVLSDAERDRLAELEARIGLGLEAFSKAGGRC